MERREWLEEFQASLHWCFLATHRLTLSVIDGSTFVLLGRLRSTLSNRIYVRRESWAVAYNFTGETGTSHYTAPELSRSEPYYRPGVDLHSLSVVMPEVLSLRKPYPGVPLWNCWSVVHYGGRRPPIDTLWLKELRVLLERMWDGDRRRRPRDDVVVNTLEAMLRGEDEGLFLWGRLRRALAARRASSSRPLSLTVSGHGSGEAAEME